jgi:hypothetical protein
MLPRETTVRQLKKLREETKETDIGDLTTNDRLNKNTPNLQYIGNPTSNLESWEEFTQKDNKLQTIAFKSKLVNKPLVKENKKENMKNELKNLISLDDFKKDWKPEEAKKTKRTEVAKDILKEGFYDTDELDITEIDDDDDDLYIKDEEEVQKDIEDREEFYRRIEKEKLRRREEEENEINWEERDINPNYYEEYDKLPEEEDDFEHEDLELNELDEKIKTFEAFQLKDVSPKEEKQPEYTMWGEEKKIEENPLFGVGAVKDKENKKIAFFTNYVIDPKTPKERPILNAGQLIDNEYAHGFINRIEGKKVFVESLDEPMKIVEISIKDAVKPKKK